MKAAGVVPLVRYPGAHKPWLSRWEACGKEVSPSLGNVRRGQGACQPCSGTAPMNPAYAEGVMRSVGLEPLEPYRTNKRP